MGSENGSRGKEKEIKENKAKKIPHKDLKRIE